MLSYEDVFWNVLPTYISIGMTPSEYWDGSPFLAVSYREANKIRTEKGNIDAWWQAFYVRDAMVSAMSQSLPWFKKPINYPTKPYRVTPLTEEEKAEEAQKEREKAIRSFTAWKEAWDKNNGR